MSTMLTIKGVYRDGKVEFSERPRDVSEETPVMVTFLTREQSQEQEAARKPGDRDKLRLAATERFLARLDKGIAFGGPPYPKREQLYDRFERTNEDPR